eukprot:EC123335.1.p1 GENE.EC123335.1~~EC123335.1.p1  ORF type:complete len:192 (+),score=31.90 EC123335.1:74-649(+)
MSDIEPSSVIEFLNICGKLKVTKRTGWVNHNVKLPESVSDHMYRMAIIGFLAPPAVNRDKVIKMALVHDLAEALVGDITPFCGVSKEEKQRREQEAMNHIRQILRESPIGDEMFSLWTEYEDGTTPEAKFVKDVDKFEMILQASEYEQAQGCDLQQFFDSTEHSFKDPHVRRWVQELRSQRTELRAPDSDS